MHRLHSSRRSLQLRHYGVSISKLELNNILTLRGLGGLTQAWLAQPPLNLFAICVVAIWKTVGLPMMLTSAALQSIPATYIEAAKIDGAGFLRQIFSLILPLIKPVIAIAVTFSLISNF